MKVELLYFDGCPGYAELREHLPHLLEQVGVSVMIEERSVDSEEAAARERFLGSPTVRVDGRDVDRTATERADYGLLCRLYPAGGVMRRTPPDIWITEALLAGH
jgi:hypothetical protein